jgi:hypothetical protein
VAEFKVRLYQFMPFCLPPWGGERLERRELVEKPSGWVIALQVGQLWMASRYEQRVNEEMQSEVRQAPAAVFWVVAPRPYDNRSGNEPRSVISDIAVPRNFGCYALKEFHLESRVPAWVRSLLPAEALVVVEESWNAYPHLISVVTSKYLSNQRFKIVVQSTFVDGDGESPNALAAPRDMLERREVIAVDVARVATTCQQHFYGADADPRLMEPSRLSGRGPFEEGGVAVWRAGGTLRYECDYVMHDECGALAYGALLMYLSCWPGRRLRRPCEHRIQGRKHPAELRVRPP